jgi:hypothetical protein
MTSTSSTGVYVAAFKALGADLLSAVEIRKVEPSYLCAFDDNTSIELYTEEERMRGGVAIRAPWLSL